MPNEIVTLSPNVGSGLILTGSYKLGMEVDWGDQIIDPQLASGSDVVGGVPGVRRREPAHSSIPVMIHEEDAADYLEAAEALASAASRLGIHGGKIQHQLDFGDGELSEERETTIYTANLSPEEGWLQAHRKHGTAVLEIDRDPAWINTTAETLVTSALVSGATIVQTYTARGNLPGPASVLAINPTVVRRYWEIGNASSQYQAADSYHYNADQFTEGAANLTADAAAIDAGGALELAGVIPTPQEVGRLEDLGNVGTYRVRVRVKGSTEEAQHFIRVVWRQSGGGPWHEIGSAPVPGGTDDAGALEYWMVEVGTLRNYSATSDPGTDTIDIRVDAYADGDSSGDSLWLDTLFLIPAELHLVSRGITIEQPPLEAALFDSWSDEEAGATAINYASTTPWGNAPIPGVAWTEYEANGSASDEFDIHWLSLGPTQGGA